MHLTLIDNKCTHPPGGVLFPPRPCPRQRRPGEDDRKRRGAGWASVFPKCPGTIFLLSPNSTDAGRGSSSQAGGARRPSVAGDGAGATAAETRPQLRATAPPRRQRAGLRAAPRRACRLPESGSRVRGVPGKPGSPRRVPGVSSRLASRDTRLVEMCTSAPIRSKCRGHCWDKKQKCNRVKLLDFLMHTWGRGRTHLQPESSRRLDNCWRGPRCRGAERAGSSSSIASEKKRKQSARPSSPLHPPGRHSAPQRDASWSLLPSERRSPR